MRVILGEAAVTHILKKGGRAAVDLISLSS